MNAYYNEIDRYCCDWLQNLMDAGHITPGKIDDRSIADLSPDDVRGYERCHFFAGIAGWELALSLSGYDGPVWTGSCPCQPFSAAGKGKAGSDERHLWPEWFRLISAVRPPVVFGEQVEAAIGWGWLDLVHSDMEPEGYTIRSAVLPACSVGAPHIRQRLWFVADAGCERGGEVRPAHRADQSLPHVHYQRRSENGELADSDGWHASTEGLQRGGEHGQREEDGSLSIMAHALPARRPQGRAGSGSGQAARGSTSRGVLDPSKVASPGWTTGFCADGIMGNADKPRSQGRRIDAGKHASQRAPWSPGSLIWLPCTDGKQRATQPGIFPLAHGVSARVAKLRAAGNAIVPQVAAEFIRAAMA